jgi:hypothetical protein
VLEWLTDNSDLPSCGIWWKSLEVKGKYCDVGFCIGECFKAYHIKSKACWSI